MAAGNEGEAATTHTEQTSLLNERNNGISNEIIANGSQSINSHASISKNGNLVAAIDEESGEVGVEELEDNSLFEGRPDVNMRFLFPAVALGVSNSAPLLSFDTFLLLNEGLSSDNKVVYRYY